MLHSVCDDLMLIMLCDLYEFYICALYSVNAYKLYVCDYIQWLQHLVVAALIVSKTDTLGHDNKIVQTSV